MWSNLPSACNWATYTWCCSTPASTLPGSQWPNRRGPPTGMDRVMPQCSDCSLRGTNPCSWECNRTVSHSSLMSLFTANLTLLFRDTLETVPLLPVVMVRTCRHGHPRKQVNPTYLWTAMAVHHGLSISRLAHLLGLYRHTVQKYLRRNAIAHRFSDISDNNLDCLVKAYWKQKPESGICYLIGFLWANGFHVPIARIRASIEWVDPVGHILCRRARIIHQNYKVKWPNALWHIDGHHKLICWGIVIHGVVHGYFWMVNLYSTSMIQYNLISIMARWFQL